MKKKLEENNVENLRKNEHIRFMRDLRKDFSAQEAKKSRPLRTPWKIIQRLHHSRNTDAVGNRKAIFGLVSSLAF